MDNIYDLIIIGAGPAGMTASVYASKANLKTLMIEKDYPGGKVVQTSVIENWPGFSSIEGYQLATTMFEHSLAFGANFKQGRVIDVKESGKYKEVICEDGSYLSYAVIIATGTKERKIGIDGEDEYYGKGVSYCAVCDGSLYKNQEMVVIGGGNSALHEALYLTNFATKIYLVHRREEFRAEPSIIEEIKNNQKITLLLNYAPVSINGDTSVTSVTIENVNTKEQKTIETKVVFPFIGSDPESRFASRLGITNEQGYIEVNEKMQTPIEGIYGAGDVIRKDLRQIVTAVNDGAIAAMNAYTYIKKKAKSN